MARSFSRRNLLGGSAIGLGALMLPSGAAAVESQNRGSKKQPKNIIVLVSDGMSCGVPAMLDHFLQLTEGRSSHWRQLMESGQAVHGYQDTRSLSSVVTDSAAASSAWGAGRHVWNGQINTLPDGTTLKCLFDIFGAKGLKRGLVSTATITHATPAGFAVQMERRDNEEGIAAQYLDKQVDVVLGGGDKFFAADKRKDGRDLYGDYSKKGYAVVKGRADLKKAGPGRVLGIFSASHVPFAIDRKSDPALADVPSLMELTQVAIDRLKGSKEGFILQVEAARVDHAAHNNDLAGLFYDQLELDQTLAAVLEFARKDGETLVIVTSDHGNSNPGLNGSGEEYFDSTAGLATLAGMKASYEVLLPKLTAAAKSGQALSHVQDLFQAQLGLKVASADAQIALDGLGSASRLRSVEQYQIPGSSVSIALSNLTHVGWTGRQHTDDYTLLTAYGPGSAAFGGLIQNITIFDRLLATRGLKYSNPSMTPEKAREIVSAKKAKALAESVADHWL